MSAPLLTDAEVRESIADHTSAHYLTEIECRVVLAALVVEMPWHTANAVARILGQRATAGVQGGRS